MPFDALTLSMLSNVAFILSSADFFLIYLFKTICQVTVNLAVCKGYQHTKQHTIPAGEVLSCSCNVTAHYLSVRGPAKKFVCVFGGGGGHVNFHATTGGAFNFDFQGGGYMLISLIIPITEPVP